MPNFPPYENLMLVLKICPKAAFQYMWLWKEKKIDTVVTYKDIVTEEFSWKSFRDNLRLLENVNLLKFKINAHNKISITLRESSIAENVA